MKLRTTNSIDKIYYLGLISIILLDVIHNLFSDNIRYEVLEWMMSLDEVLRRGAIGSVLKILAVNLNISPFYVIQGICLITLLFLYKSLNQLFDGRINKLLLFSPLLFGFVVINLTYLRKDGLLLLLLIFLVKQLASNPKLLFLLLNFVLGVIVHELYLFMALPLIAYHFYRHEAKKAGLVLKLVPFLIIVAILMSLSKIDLEFHQAWGPILAGLKVNKVPFDDVTPTPFLFTDFGVFDIISFSRDHFTWKQIVPAFPVFIFTLWWIDKSISNKSMYRQVFALVTVSIFPLFIMGVDWGRWMVLIHMVSLIYVFSADKNVTIDVGNLGLIKKLAFFILPIPIFHFSSIVNLFYHSWSGKIVWLLASMASTVKDHFPELF